MKITHEDYFSSSNADSLIGKFIAILGSTGSGKSNTGAVLMEEARDGGIPICVIDIAGEYFKLKDDYPEITIVGRSLNCVTDVPMRQDEISNIAETAYVNGSSVVLDISGYDPQVRPDILAQYFGKIWDIAAIYRIPLIIFVEEAHNWIPQGKKTAVSDTFVNISAEGRKRGLSMVLMAQRSARVDKNAITAADLYFLHKVRHPVDMKVYSDLLPWKKAVTSAKVNSLRVGQAYIMKDDRVLKGTIRKRRTQHFGDTPTAKNIPQGQTSLFSLLNKAKE